MLCLIEVICGRINAIQTVQGHIPRVEEKTTTIPKGHRHCGTVGTFAEASIDDHGRKSAKDGLALGNTVGEAHAQRGALSTHFLAIPLVHYQAHLFEIIARLSIAESSIELCGHVSEWPGRRWRRWRL